jgi:uncharacterized repeat protein (TIGR01451 family)
MPFFPAVPVRPRGTVAALALLAVALAWPVSASAANPSADLATTLSGSPAHAYGYVYFRITVTNNGPDAADNVVITDATPPRSTFYCASGTSSACGAVPAGVTCKPPPGSTGTMTCTMASLPKGASVTVWMGVHLGFFFHNQAFGDSATATSTTPDPNPSNNTATVVLRVM